MLNEKNGTTHGAFPTTLIFRRNRREHPVLLSRASYPPIGCDSRTLQQIRTSQTYQNFPTRPLPSNESEPKFRLCNGGGLVGKFGEDKGGLEGEGNPSERGVLLPPRSSSPTSNIPSFPRLLAPRRRERRLRDGGPRHRCRCSARRGSRAKAHRPPSSSPQSASGQDAPASSP